MDKELLLQLLREVQEGKLKPEQAVERLKVLPYEDLGFAKIDHHRGIRRGFPEVVYCKSKTAAQAALIVERLAAQNNVLATRVEKETFAAIRQKVKNAEYHEVGKAVTVKNFPIPQKKGKVLVLCGGTSDIPVAEEAAITAEMAGCTVEKIHDVGVAGLHRLLSYREKLVQADVLIVIAGMEGALPSVVAGLTDKPIIAVPTSVGYGASFQGLAPLLTMLNSCSPGIVVVNIDNGFGAGYFAGLLCP